MLNLAWKAFEKDFGKEELASWMEIFIQRFFRNQFKRTASPEGIQVFPRRLVPLTAWQMPGDAMADLWIDEAKNHFEAQRE